MKVLEILEAKINEVAYNRAMERAKKSKSVKNWERLSKKLDKYIEEETEKIINNIVNPFCKCKENK